VSAIVFATSTIARHMATHCITIISGQNVVQKENPTRPAACSAMPACWARRRPMRCVSGPAPARPNTFISEPSDRMAATSAMASPTPSA
jgi:hypothetical protein